MTVTKDDFEKVWASSSPLTPYSFSASQYKEGWNFIGSTPPSRQMWDFLQKQNDEKMQYLASTYLPLSGGTMTGSIQYVNNGKVFSIGNTGTGNVDLGWSYANREGAGLGLRSTDYSTPGESPGEFTLFARDANNTCSLTGNPGGSLTWNNKEIATTVVGAVVAFAGRTTPQGWLLCDGSAVSRTGYAALYAVIGTTYGAGNGSTTFNLPNLTDKFVEGSATAGTVKSAGLPNITGKFKLTDNVARNGLFAAVADSNGAFALINSDHNVVVASNTSTAKGSLSDIVLLDASNSNSIYGNSTTVQPPALTMRYIIKY